MAQILPLTGAGRDFRVLTQLQLENRRRVSHNIPAVKKRLVKFPVTLTAGSIRVTSEWLRVLQLKSHCDETHLDIFTCAKSTSFLYRAAHFQVTPCFVCQFCFHKRGPAQLWSRWISVEGFVYLALFSAAAAAAATRCAHNATNPPSDGRDALTCPSMLLPRPLQKCTVCVHQCVEKMLSS
ncbi:hypothetical protein ABVT39_025179 [Epinephelus coioides]